MSRADSMRALMLVLPYNTDNNTEENLQELYTRPPVTRVIDAYTQPNPIKFLTPDPNAAPRSTVPGGNPAVAATTYKPAYGGLGVKQQHQLYAAPTATTYHPPAPAPVMYQLTPSLGRPSMDFQPVTSGPHAYDFTKLQAAPPPPAGAGAASPVSPVAAPPSATAQRFSSHYNAKNAQFLRKPNRPKPAQQQRATTSSSTVKPVADILESLGIVGGGAAAGAATGGQSTHKRYAIDDYYPAESAPKPVVAVADLRGLQGARIRPDAYSNFKPLNIGEELRVKPEVEGYLTRFGIVKKSPKALKKSQAGAPPTEEPAGAHTELSTATAKLPAGNQELVKLLENLHELERLQAKVEARKQPVTSTTTTSTTTTTTTTAAPPTPMPTAQLITHGAPLLIEPKKPRRRIDPNIDINFANAGNHQKESSSTDELAKLLQNLQELEKLQINAENVLKANQPAQSLSNRFSIGASASTTPAPTVATTRSTTRSTSTTTRQPAGAADARELQSILRQLQQLEEANAVLKAARTTTTSTSTTTTQRPRPRQSAAQAFGLDPSLTKGFGPGDLAQLQRLFSDDSQLEALYEQARNTKKGIKGSTTSSPTTSSSTSTTTSTTTTTPRPTKAAAAVDHAQFEALITRVQQLEQLQQPKATTPGFSTRNVAASGGAVGAASPALGLPSNDYAQLQQLAAQSYDLDPYQGQVEISTAASTSKQRQRPLNQFERSNGLLQDVQPHDYVQLQKLLSKVQELERVQLQETRPTTGTGAHQLVTAASVRTQNVKSLNGAQIVYAQPAALAETEQLQQQQQQQTQMPKLELPVYRQPIASTPNPGLSSSEELREYAMSKPAHPQLSTTVDQDFAQYQQFFSSLEDGGERQHAYPNMQPIYKTVTPAPSKATTKQADLAELQKLLYNTAQLQKLGVALPNELSQQLETQLQTQPTSASVSAASSSSSNSAPSSSSLSTTSSTSTTSTTTSTPAPTSASSPLPTHDSSSPAVFSLTTSRPSSPRIARPQPTTESSVELPIFSATKIIEAAIKRAANRIGVSTEQPLDLAANMAMAAGFRRRSDDETDLDAGDSENGDGVLDGDLMAEFSELNYQLAKPEPTQAEPVQQPAPVKGPNLSELQRLISNLQELQSLNVNLSKPVTISPQSQADAIYLQSQQPHQTDTTKPRRQSQNSTSAPTLTLGELAEAEAATATTQSPTRISLNLGLSDDDTDSDASGSSSSTTEESPSSSTTTEESRNGSLDDLADSFGPDPVSQEPPPAKKKNGFYFLADWNSFLEVGDGDDQVVVRLSPKIGDPRDFLPV